MGQGLLRRGRQRTDSTRVVADVRLMDRMEFVAETLRAALEALTAAAPAWLEQALAERETVWLGRYGERVDSWHGLPDGQDREVCSRRGTTTRQHGSAQRYAGTAPGLDAVLWQLNTACSRGRSPQVPQSRVVTCHRHRSARVFA